MPSRGKTRLGRGRGFSLTELLIVVAVVLIISAMAIPNILSTLESYRLDSTGNLVAGKLTDARINAVKLNRQAWLALDAATRTFVVQTIDPANPALVLTLGSTETLPQGLVFVSPPTPAQIIFDSLGRPTSVPAAPPHTVQLQVVRSGQQKSVTVSPSGRILVN